VIALVRTEFVKAARRTRTLVVFLVLVGLPTLIVIAIHARGNRVDRGDEGVGLFRLAHLSGLLVPASVLAVPPMSGFFLVVVAGVFAGDAIAGDAAWGNLRYLLMRPVSRTRLLIAKTFVAGVLIWACTLLVVIAALIGGVILFGAHPVSTTDVLPTFAQQFVKPITLSEQTLVLRVGIATAYTAFGYTAVLAIGMFCSTLTDVPAGAMGATIGAYIVSEVLDGITQFGRIRYFLPTHYLTSWQSMFTANTYSHDMIAGLLVQVGYLVVFGAAAIAYFARKDIRS
jgi:ABC-2 type transport system permease protein